MKTSVCLDEQSVTSNIVELLWSKLEKEKTELRLDWLESVRVRVNQRHKTTMQASGLLRNVRNVVHNYTEVEIKVREATSNDPWGPRYRAFIMANFHLSQFVDHGRNRGLNLQYDRFSGNNGNHLEAAVGHGQKLETCLQIVSAARLSRQNRRRASSKSVQRKYLFHSNSQRFSIRRQVRKGFIHFCITFFQSGLQRSRKKRPWTSDTTRQFAERRGKTAKWAGQVAQKQGAFLEANNCHGLSHGSRDWHGFFRENAWF